MVREIASVTTKESFPPFHKRNHIIPDVYAFTILILMNKSGAGDILIWIIQFRAFSFEGSEL